MGVYSLWLMAGFGLEKGFCAKFYHFSHKCIIILKVNENLWMDRFLIALGPMRLGVKCGKTVKFVTVDLVFVGRFLKSQGKQEQTSRLMRQADEADRHSCGLAGIYGCIRRTDERSSMGRGASAVP
jgi:hypothetical protein